MVKCNNKLVEVRDLCLVARFETKKLNGHQNSVVVIRNTRDWTSPKNTSADDGIFNVVT
jgi:hypothetical protein